MLREVLAVLLLLVFCFPSSVWGRTCETKNEEYFCNEILVRFAPKATNDMIDQAIEDHSLYPVNSSVDGKTLLMEDYSGEKIEDTLKNLEEAPGVLTAEPNYVIRLERTPNDPYYSYLWGINNTGQFSGVSGNDILAEEAWEVSTGSDDVIVAVIDTGVDYTHPDLAANMWTNSGEIPDNDLDDDGNGYIDDYYGYDFWNYDGDPYDDHGHGTHVSGTIAAVGNNGIGVVGVAWKTKIMALKFLSAGGYGSYYDAVLALDYARNKGAKITSNSWGGYGYSSSLAWAISRADSGGMLVIAASGNDAYNTDYYPHYPSSYSYNNVISVAAISYDESIAYFSNYGYYSVDVGAPGVWIYSTYPSSRYAYMSGTSMATPHVSGVAAMLWAIYPGKTHREIKDLILNGGRELSSLTNKTVSGKTLSLWGSILEGDPSLSNHAPVASAGSDRTVAVGATVQVNGSATDDDGDTVTFSWTLADPNGDTTQVSSRSSSNSFSFVPTTAGVYTAGLTVHDAYTSSSVDYVRIEAKVPGTTLPPTVSFKHTTEQGNDFDSQNGRPKVPLKQKIKLDASNSTSFSTTVDLAYEWSLVSKPEGSAASIESADQAIAYLEPDTNGDYVVRLTITDDISTSEAEVNFLASEETESPDDPSDPGAIDINFSLGCQLNSHANAPWGASAWLLGFLTLVFLRKFQHRSINS